MLVVDKIKEEGYFGDKQATVSRVFFFFYQLILYVCIGIAIYAVLTFQFQILLALVIISIIQMPIGRSQNYIDFVNKYIQPLKYFKHFEIIYQEIIPDESRCLFGVHPHSVFGLGLLASMNSSKTGNLSNMVGLSSRFILYFPIIGLILKMWGVKAVNPTNVKKLMKEGKSIGLLPGGFEEATITSKHEMRCYINNRKGFIKYAIENNYVIYPVLMLKQHQAFSTFEPWLKFRLFLNKIKLPGIFFWNFSTGLFMPPQLSLHIIVGKGIRAKQELT